MFNVLIDINYNHFLHLGSSQICVGDILAFSFRYRLSTHVHTDKVLLAGSARKL